MKSLLLSSLLFMASVTHAEQIIYVDQAAATSQAKGQLDGSLHKPYRTIQQAKMKVRALLAENRQQNIQVNIASGHYAIENSIQFGKKDSPADGFSVRYVAQPDAEVILSGIYPLPISEGKILQPGAFVSALVEPQASKHILQFELPNHVVERLGAPSRFAWGLDSVERLAPAIVLQDAQRLHLSRWPDIDERSEYMVMQHFTQPQRPLRGYEKKVQRIIDKTDLPGEVSYVSVLDSGDKAKANPNGRGGTVKVAFDRMKHWQQIDQIFVDGVLSSTWEWSYNQLQSADVKQQTLTFRHPEINGLGVGESVRLPHFHFQNIPEELTQAGEYYFDRAKAKLYVYPRSEKPLQLVLLDDAMLRFNHASNIHIEGLTLEGGRDLAVEMIKSRAVAIKNNTIRNFTAGAIAVDGSDNLVTSNHIHGIGAFAVSLTGGNKRTLRPANNVVSNNHIHDFGWELKSQQAGVYVQGVGHLILNNTIHDASHFAIRVQAANDVLIEGNEIFDLPKYHHFDGGALYVYSGHQPQARGVKIRQNYLHDIPTHGIYPDNFSWGVHIYNNVFNRVGVKASRAPIMVNGGGENVSYNNVVIDSPEIYRQGARPKDAWWMERWLQVKQRFSGKNWQHSPYKKYPDFKAWLEKTEPEEFYRPASFVVNNLLVNNSNDLLQEAKPSGVVDKSGALIQDRNRVVRGDLGFESLENGDFRFSESARINELMPEFKSFIATKVNSSGNQ